MENQISANLYSQLNHEVRELFQFKGIILHNNDGFALTKDTIFTVINVGHKKCKPTTRGWKVLLEWRDDTATWVDLKDIKEASPIELSEYAVGNKINDETDFAWWVHYVFNKRDRITAKAKI